jgi:hypothetical protein
MLSRQKATDTTYSRKNRNSQPKADVLTAGINSK